jgi:formylmethanofuran dehydrogenase subunit E
VYTPNTVRIHAKVEAEYGSSQITETIEKVSSRERGPKELERDKKVAWDMMYRSEYK